MKLIIDIPEEKYKSITENACESVYNTHDIIALADSLKNSTPFDDVKFRIEHMACRQYEHRLTLDRQEVIEILDNIDKEERNE